MQLVLPAVGKYTKFKHKKEKVDAASKNLMTAFISKFSKRFSTEVRGELVPTQFHH